MARAVDLSAFDTVRSLSDYDKAALEEARQRYVQAQQIDLQRQAAQRKNDMFELEKQKFEAEKAQPDQMFGGNSFQAQLGNQMKKMGMSDEQIVQALTMKGIPLQNGGYATYSPYDVTGGAPNTGSKAPEPLQGPANQSAPAGRGMSGPPDIDAIKNEVGNIMSGRGPANVLVPSGLSEAEKEAQKQIGKDKRLITNRMSALEEAKSILNDPNVNATESQLGAWRNDLQKELGMGGDKERDTNARLNVIGGFLTSSVPRMEGPQSDKDTELYRAMAGKIGDNTATIQERLSALSALEALSNKYAENIGMTTQQKYDEGDQDIDPRTGRVLATFTNGRWIPNE